MIHSRLAMQGIAYTCAPHQVGLLSTSQQPRGVSHVSGKTIHQEPGESQVAPRPTPIETIAPQVMTSPSPRAANEALATAGLYHTSLIFSAGHSLYCSQRERRVREYCQATVEETQLAAPAGSLVPAARTGSHLPHVRHSEYPCIQVFARR